MTAEQQKAYEWAIAQNYPSVAARYAKLLAETIDELNDFEHSQCAKLLAERDYLLRRLAEINDLAVGYENEGPFEQQEAFDRVQKITNLSIPEVENLPLTLEQLRRMDGMPAWVVDLRTNSGWYALIGAIEDKVFAQPLCGISTWCRDYGKTWLAYARKPGQEANHE